MPAVAWPGALSSFGVSAIGVRFDGARAMKSCAGRRTCECEQVSLTTGILGAVRNKSSQKPRQEGTEATKEWRAQAWNLFYGRGDVNELELSKRLT